MWAGAAELPLWIIVHDDDYAATGDVCIAADWSKTSRTRYIPFFFSERAARRYMAKAKTAFALCRPLSLRTIKSVVAALDIAESKGIDHVVSKEFDHRYIILASIRHVGGFRQRNLSIINEIDELVSIDAFRRSLRQQ